MSPPLAGGVAFVEMPAETTCGIAATAARSRSKYSERSFQVGYVPSWTGIGSDIVFCGSYPSSAFARRRNPFPAAPAAVSISSVSATWTRDHHAMNAPALRAADDPPRARLRDAAEIRARELQRRPDAEHDRRHDRPAPC